MKPSSMKLLLLSCVTTFAFTTTGYPSPWALSFGTSTIIASRLGASGNIDIRKFDASDEYTTYVSDALVNYGKRIQRLATWYLQHGDDLVLAPPDTHNRTTTQHLFKDTVDGIVKELDDGQERDLSYAAFTLPSIFNDSSISAARDALLHLFEPMRDGPLNVRDAAHMVGYAYGLFECAAFGRTTEECASDEMVNLVLVMDVQRDYLFMNLVEPDLEYQVFPSLGKKLLKDYGSEKIKSLRRKFGVKLYNDQLYIEIRRFIDKILHNGGLKLDRNVIRAIVVAGETDSGVVSELEQLASRAIDNDAVKILNGIDSELVVAHGAALYARDILKWTENWKEYYQMHGESGHSEL